MTDFRPFVLRRTTGGDLLRPDPADTSIWQALLRYGPRVVTPEEVAGTELLAMPYRYEGVIFTVKIPETIDWSQAMVARGGFGFPTTPLDGVAVFYTNTKPVGSDMAQRWPDRPLTPGNWYYYTLFLWIGGQWVPSARVDVLLPQDYGHSQLLMDGIPPYYVRMDDNRAADGRNGPLRLFASVLGYDLDLMRTLLDGVLDIYDPDKVPYRLMRYLGDNMGFPYEQVLGAARYRSILTGLLPLRQFFGTAPPGNLNNLRGTADGLTALVTAASDYQCDAIQGANILPSPDDSEFVGGGPYYPTDPEYASTGVGLWGNLTHAAALTEIGATPSVAQFAKGTDITIIPPKGRGYLVIASVADDIVMSVGVHDATTEPVFKAVPVEPGGLYDFQADIRRSTSVPQSDVWLGVLWYGVSGAITSLIKDDRGPTVPHNYDSSTAWVHTDVQFFAPSVDATPPDAADAYYAVPYVWWSTPTPTALAFPANGHYLAGVMFSRIEAAGGNIVPLPPDVLLTLGAPAKTIGEHPGGEYYIGDRTGG